MTLSGFIALLMKPEAIVLYGRVCLLVRRKSARSQHRPRETLDLTPYSRAPCLVTCRLLVFPSKKKKKEMETRLHLDGVFNALFLC